MYRLPGTDPVDDASARPLQVRLSRGGEHAKYATKMIVYLGGRRKQIWEVTESRQNLGFHQEFTHLKYSFKAVNLQFEDLFPGRT